MDASDAGGQKGAARRARLRQYQEQLLERMQAARTSKGTAAHQLGMEIVYPTFSVTSVIGSSLAGLNESDGFSWTNFAHSSPESFFFLK